MASSPEKALQSMIDNMPAKTGKSLSEWLRIVAATEHQKHGHIVKHLKTEHGMTHGFANLVAMTALTAGTESGPQALLAAQYAKTASLRPVYDRITAAVRDFGDDAAVSIKKSYVSPSMKS